MANSIAPYFVKLFYESSFGQHVAQIPVNVQVGGVVGANYGFILGNGGSIAWGLRLNSFVSLLRPLMNTTSTFTYAELWSFNQAQGRGLFLEFHEVNLAGTSPTATSSGLQCVWSFRTRGGGTGRLQLLDIAGILAPNLKGRAPSYGNAGVKAVADDVGGEATFFYGRDNTYAAFVPFILTKFNDALRRKRLLAS